MIYPWCSSDISGVKPEDSAPDPASIGKYCTVLLTAAKRASKVAAIMLPKALVAATPWPLPLYFPAPRGSL